MTIEKQFMKNMLVKKDKTCAIIPIGVAFYKKKRLCHLESKFSEVTWEKISWKQIENKYKYLIINDQKYSILMLEWFIGVARNFFREIILQNELEIYIAKDKTQYPILFIYQHMGCLVCPMVERVNDYSAFFNGMFAK